MQLLSEEELQRIMKLKKVANDLNIRLDMVSMPQLNKGDELKVSSVDKVLGIYVSNSLAMPELLFRMALEDSND